MMIMMAFRMTGTVTTTKTKTEKDDVGDEEDRKDEDKTCRVLPLNLKMFILIDRNGSWSGFG